MTQKEKEFLIWLAGFIDGDGSIHIGVRLQQQAKKPYIAIMPHITITQHIKYLSICEEIQKHLKMGRIYTANRGSSLAKATWEVFRWDEAIDLLEIIEPYLRVKKEQAIRSLPVLKAWYKKSLAIRKDGALRVAGKTLRTAQEVEEMIAVATTLNSDMKTSAQARGYKTLKDWKPIIKKLYK